MSGNIVSEKNEDRECPLCLEPLELDDLNFFPCACGYQICRFCWHRIRTNENGLCPACRKQYSEDPANFKPLTAEELQKIKSEKKQKDLQRKQKMSESKKLLANVRVVQKNLVFVVGLPTKLADPEELKKYSYFGKFGKVVKVIVNHSTSYAGSQGASSSAYVTYQKAEDALRAIQAVNNSKINGRTLKASLGTTKYCSNFLKKIQCSKQDCMYLHELGDDAASFTKEEMQSGLHQEYEQKLYEQMIANSSSKSRKQASPVDHNITSAAVFQKEQWPSPKQEESDCTSSKFTNTCQSPVPLNSSSGNNTTQESLVFDHKKVHSNIVKSAELDKPFLPQQNVLDRSECLQAVQNRGAVCATSSSSVLQNSTEVLNCTSPVQQNVNHVQIISKLLPFENLLSSVQPETAVQQQQVHSEMLSKPQQINSLHHFESKSQAPHPLAMVNGLSHRKILHPSYNWPNGQMRDCFKSTLSETSHNGDPSFMTSPAAKVSAANSFPPTRMNSAPFNLCDGVQSHDCLNTRHDDFCQNGLKDSSSASESSGYSQDDDLGFDPWHESSKGLADLMMKEADKKANTNGAVLNLTSLGGVRQTLTVCDSVSRNIHRAEFSNVAQRQVIPPPGFSVNNYGINSVQRSAFSDSFSGKILPVMSICNRLPSAQVVHHQPSNIHLPTSNPLNFRETELRPQASEWQQNFGNMYQRNVDINNLSSLSHHLPTHVPRVPSSMWSNTSFSEALWQQQPEQNLSHGLLESRNISPTQMEKMLQQLKLNEQAARLQNHIKYTPYSAYRGGSS